MSVDTLRDKIRKTKNPIIVDFSLGKAMLPSHLLEKHTTPANAYGCFCREIMGRLKGMVPGVRFSFAAFSARSTSSSVFGMSTRLLSRSGFSAVVGMFQVFPVKKAPAILPWAQ